MTRKKPSNLHCPICEIQIAKEVRISKDSEGNDILPDGFDPMEHCENEWFLHMEDILFLKKFKGHKF